MRRSPGPSAASSPAPFPAAAALSAAALLAAAALALAACDRRPSTRVEGRVAVPEGTHGALVLPLEGARRPFLVDPASGRFAGSYGALGVTPRSIHLLVHVPGQRPLILEPGRDFELRARGDAFSASIDVDPARARAARVLPLSCLADMCSAKLPAEAEGCSATGVLLDGISTSLFAPSRQGAPGAEARLVAPLPMREGRARSLLLVLTCDGEDYVSDLAQFDGPP